MGCYDPAAGITASQNHMLLDREGSGNPSPFLALEWKVSYGAHAPRFFNEQ